MLNQELIAANANREQLEVDFKKSRHDMKTQMDKLRSNMHNLLSHQGDTAKALENQVTQMQVETDALRDALQLSQQTKARNDMENSHLRSDLQKFKDEAKSHMDENAVLHSQVSYFILLLLDLHLSNVVLCFDVIGYYYVMTTKICYLIMHLHLMTHF